MLSISCPSSRDLPELLIIGRNLLLLLSKFLNIPVVRMDVMIMAFGRPLFRFFEHFVFSPCVLQHLTLTSFHSKQSSSYYTYYDATTTLRGYTFIQNLRDPVVIDLDDKLVCCNRLLRSCVYTHSMLTLNWLSIHIGMSYLPGLHPSYPVAAQRLRLPLPTRVRAALVHAPSVDDSLRFPIGIPSSLSTPPAASPCFPFPRPPRTARAAYSPAVPRHHRLPFRYLSPPSAFTL